MSFWQRLFPSADASEEPRPRDVLVAHLQALRERRDFSGSALRVLPEQGELRVVVEAGLQRLEVVCSAPSEFSIRVGSCSFLSAPRDPASVKRRRERLLELGLTRERASKDFCLLVRGEQHELPGRVAERVEVCLSRLFGQSREAPYSVALERDPLLDDAELEQSMRTLAKQRDLDARRVVYQHVINAKWILPLRPTPDVLALASVDVWPEPLGRREVWPVFSSRAAATLGEKPRELSEVLSGIQLVRAAVEHAVGSIRINPYSAVGGELYANELGALAAYLDRLGIAKVTNTP